MAGSDRHDILNTKLVPVLTDASVNVSQWNLGSYRTVPSVPSSMYSVIGLISWAEMATNQTKPSTYSKDVQALYIPQAAEFKATNILLTLVENYYLQGGHTALKVLESP